jgi:hypothetical protein
MMSMVSRAAGAAVLSVLLANGALAQGITPPANEQRSPRVDGSNAGIGKKTTDPKQIDKGQNMILPSAGESGPSAAPTMVYDCEKKPQDCTVPATPADKAGASHNKAIKP